MKFAKQIKEDAVPEWRPKYLDYKQCKKKLKAAARAIRAVEPSPFSTSRPGPFGTSSREAPVYGFLTRGKVGVTHRTSQLDRALSPVRSRSEVASPTWHRQDALERGDGVDEYSPLTSHGDADSNMPARMSRYGSIIGSPQSSAESLRKQYTASLLELPDAALDPAQDKDAQKRQVDDPDYDRPVSPGSPEIPARRPPPTQLSHTGNAYEIRKPVDQPVSRLKSILKPRRANSSPSVTRPAFMQRVMSIAGTGSSFGRDTDRNNDVALEAYKEVDFRRAEFFVFLEKELDKIEDFYKAKENEATERLELLRKQLHILRNHRIDEIEASGRHKRKAHFSNGHAQASGSELKHAITAPPDGEHHHHHHLRASVVSQMDNALDKIRTGHVGETSKAMRDLGTPSFRFDPDNRDYTRKQEYSGVSYRAAKRKLKTAIVEYYRALELLKAYCSVNQTAFRKITKKCDKTFSDAPGKQFMDKRVNRAHFMNSGSVDQLADRTEDLYARYFEQGNRKTSINKLRQKTKTKDQSLAAMHSGILLGAGLLLAIWALISGLSFVYDSEKGNDATYLFQLYGGFLLPLIVANVFCFVSVLVFNARKIDYIRILQLDRRTALPWQELCQLPATAFLILGAVTVVNFWPLGPIVSTFTWWPIVLSFLIVGLVCLPLPVYFAKTRAWFLGSLIRLFAFGLIEVEFRDVLFGDILCSLTYTFGNIELFFCLYATYWKDPQTCSSSSARSVPAIIFGFMTAIPGIIRFCHCIRRFYDSQKPWPNLFNAGKYAFTILGYVFLSVWRRNKTPGNLGLFVVFSTINSIYCTFWDLAIDWSLFETVSQHFLLRRQLHFPVWSYYSAMIVDTILRFNWVLYAVFAEDKVHSPTVGISVAASEVLRRCIWVFFRVENEQVAHNNDLSAANVPLAPYGVDGASHPTGTDETQLPSTTNASPTLARLRSGIVAAHTEDHVRKPERQEESDDD